MVKIDKQTKRIYEDNDPYLHTEEAKKKEFLEKYFSSVCILNPEKSEVAKRFGYTQKGLYALQIK